MPDLELASVRAAWELLGRPTLSELNSLPAEISGLDVRFAVDSSGGRHLLVELLDAPFLTGGGQHLHESIRNLSFAGVVRTYLDVSVADPRLMPEFDMIIIDVTREGERISALQVHQALERWRTLFRILAHRVLSREQLLGLTGELVLLRHLLVEQPGLSPAWKGPAGGIHDFEVDAACIEVKSATPRSEAVMVHGLEQLQTHQSRPLFLVACIFEETDSAPTVADRIGEIRGLVTDPTFFDGGLRGSGWSDACAPGPRFGLLEAIVVKVDDEIPRLLPAEAGGVPAGIVSADYEIDIGRLRSLADPKSLESTIAELLQ